MKEVDVVIIGSGIAGISAAIYLKRSSLSFVLLDKSMPGGKLNIIHRIDNYPGYPSISGLELSKSLLEQCKQLGIEFSYGEVNKVEKVDSNFLTRTDVDSYLSKVVIVASGLSEAKLNIPGEKQYFGKGVSYCATCDGPFFKNKDVAIYGYKDFAFEDAIYLSSLVNRLYFILPKSPLATETHLNEVKKAKNITIFDGYSLKEIKGDNKVNSIVINKDNENKELEVSAIFPLFEQISSSSFLSPLSIKMSNGFIDADKDGKTNVDGVYAVGDIVNKKLRQLINAASEGALAAISSINYVRSKK
ncbi:MAG: FAD-dependent oxidoreductase [Bacillales bacterium]|nr:FAD-dependent oxidoreductase [Bacillales bacterium]MDD7714510.1 FAD-dependent oxidoreductase [Mollicutes bacterium]MDY3904633.1 FAD-dependent oxidoreductase [Candidatus Enteromonas sp.]MDY4936312.1 FAD-dependent oxidoreductase [Candidatus Enteromonas sp.]